MSDSAYMYVPNKSMDVTDFYAIETPPSSSTSKDSTDESLLSFKAKDKLKLSRTNVGQRSNHSNVCSALKSNSISNSIPIKDDEVIIFFLLEVFLKKESLSLVNKKKILIPKIEHTYKNNLNSSKFDSLYNAFNNYQLLINRISSIIFHVRMS